MTELGQIEKPTVESFRTKRKLYCVSSVYPIHNAPADYTALINKYWDEVTEQTEKLEAAGKIKKIFCESIYVQGEDALNALAKINEKALHIIKKKIEEGAVLLPIETKNIFGPFVDWANCLNVVKTPEVFTKVFEFFIEISDKRFQHIMNMIEGNLAEGEAGMLIMKNEDRAKLQFPSDIEVFLVTPPSYDDILRWFREKARDFNEQE